jgi:membrane associated rhomboid family serine protease
MIPLQDDTASDSKPYVTIALIAACVAVFLWQRSLDPAAGRRVVDALGAIPAVLLTHARLPPDLQWVPRFATPFTAMFLHAGWLHLLGNMLYLWIYGDNVEDSLGHWRYLAFYAVCGTAAVLAQALSAPQSAYPIIGASGAISGVLGAYLLLFPRAREQQQVGTVFLHYLAAAGDVVVAAVVRGSIGERSDAAGWRRRRGLSRSHRRIPHRDVIGAPVQTSRGVVVRMSAFAPAVAVTVAVALAVAVVEPRCGTFGNLHTRCRSGDAEQPGIPGRGRTRA